MVGEVQEGVLPLWVHGSFSPPASPHPFPTAGGVITEGTGEAAARGGQLLLQPLAQVWCLLLRPPAQVSELLRTGSEASPSFPCPPRVLPKRQLQTVIFK